MPTNNKKKDTKIKIYYECFKALRNLSISLLCADAFLLILGFISHTIFVALILFAVINIATSILLFLDSVNEIKKLKKYKRD